MGQFADDDEGRNRLAGWEKGVDLFFCRGVAETQEGWEIRNSKHNRTKSGVLCNDQPMRFGF